MKLAVVSNAVVFWLLLLAMVFGQETRDPTMPSPAIQQKLTRSLVDSPDRPTSQLRVRAIVLSDRDHGTALVQTANGVVHLRLARDKPIEVVLDEYRYSISDFDASSITLLRVGPLAAE